MRRVSLPIDEVLPQLVETLRDHLSVVIQAPTGAGKTTRVPPAVLDGVPIDPKDKIIMLEPRRVAARAAARRIAEERGGRVGDEVGYQIRFDRRAGPKTRILIVTEGVLVRMLQADPFLEGVGAVIFDEFHERSLNVDLALALSRRVQEEARDDLRLVVMSATLDTAPIARWLGDCPVVISEGRAHPVDVRHLDRASTLDLPQLAVEGVRSAMTSTSGDVLVFLPGVGEIRRTAARLESLHLEASVVQLYGDLSPERQDEALRPSPGRRKIVLATNVAETSLTIPGVRAVVDTGFAKVMRFDPNTGLDRLELKRISRASADQRAGRAGREAPGICLRLWPEHLHRTLAEFDEAEIHRVDLSGPSLEVLAWGEPSLEDFEWYEAPDPSALERARALLVQLGALDGRGVTPIGHQMARWPVHPRLARLMIEAHKFGHPQAGTWLAALLAERDPFVRGTRFGGTTSPSDLLDRLQIVRAAARGSDSRVHRGGMWTLKRAQAQLQSVARRVLGKAPSPSKGEQEALLRAVLAAFPDRVARRREPGGARARMVGGRGVSLAPDSAVREAALFVCVRLDPGPRGERPEALVRWASGVERGWLAGVSVGVEVVFDPERARVMAVSRTRYGDLMLDERPARSPDPTQAAELLADEAMGQLDKATALLESPASDLLARIRSLAGWMPELSLPTFEGDSLRALLLSAAQGRRAFTELRKAPWEALILGALDWSQRAALDREAPERFEVPSGSRVRLRYEEGQPPVLAVRIQEVFGLADTPRVASGRVPVIMHLLAPNMRPQQVTRDLRSFWDNTYTEVRKELRQRYPKHAWPEDPWRAKPQRRPQRRRRKD